MRVFILSARRTPFGAFGGKLKSLSATDLAVHAASAALASAKGVSPALVDCCVAGSVAQTSADAAYLARHVALRVGAPESSTALTVNRLCGSGFQAVVSAIHELRDVHTGSGVAIAVGTESMSQAPYAIYGHHARFGVRLGSPPALVDTLSTGLSDSYCNTAMGETAEIVATTYGISRAECDAYALASQARFEAARAAGVFAAEIAPIELVPTKKGAARERYALDEHARPSTTAEGLAKLSPVFKGVVTAGNASGIVDGAAACVLATEAAVARLSLEPLASVIAWSTAGVGPRVMGLGPIAAVRKLMASRSWPAGLQLRDVGFVEINEAFAAQVIACGRDLAADGLDAEAQLNQHGGAIAVGHPLGASGARILGHLAHCLAASGQRYALASACIGGGQGIALLIENARR